MMNMIRPLWLFLVLSVVAGCAAAKIPHVIVPDYGKRLTSLIAVAPIQSGSADPRAADMLRSKLVEELHFKGYPRIPAKAIDGALAEWAARGENPSPQQVGERLKVDAVLYVTLHESHQGRGILYASTAVEAAFELRSTRTGESLWRTQHRAVRRNYGLTSRSVELKSSQVYETAIQEVVDRALETLPDASGS